MKLICGLSQENHFLCIEGSLIHYEVNITAPGHLAKVELDIVLSSCVVAVSEEPTVVLELPGYVEGFTTVIGTVECNIEDSRALISLNVSGFYPTKEDACAAVMQKIMESS